MCIRDRGQFETDLFNSCHSLPNQGNLLSNQFGYGRVDAGKLLGLTSTGVIEARLKSNWSDCYAYIWNSINGIKQNDWPGSKLANNNGEFTVNIDFSKYDSVIFTQTNNGPQTPDLLVSSFVNGGIYDLTSSIKEDKMNFLIGSYK